VDPLRVAAELAEAEKESPLLCSITMAETPHEMVWLRGIDGKTVIVKATTNVPVVGVIVAAVPAPSTAF